MESLNEQIRVNPDIIETLMEGKGFGYVVTHNNLFRDFAYRYCGGHSHWCFGLAILVCIANHTTSFGSIRTFGRYTRF